MGRIKSLADVEALSAQRRNLLTRASAPAAAPDPLAGSPFLPQGQLRRVSRAEFEAWRAGPPPRRRRPYPLPWLDAGPKLDGLLPFQPKACHWLREDRYRLLADDMGLGKTVETVCALDVHHGALIVCPASLRRTWEKALSEWRPELSVRHLSSSMAPWLPAVGEVVIATYAQLSQIFEFGDGEWLFPAEDWAHVTLIADEIQFLKNYKAHCTIAWMKLAPQVGRVWGLTGTPMEKDPPDLWGVLSAAQVSWRAFPRCEERSSLDEYQAMFGGVRTHWGGVDYPAVPPDPEQVKEALARVMLRRMKRDVLSHLPAKTYQNVYVDVTDALMDQCDMVLEQWDRETESYDLPEGPSFELPKFAEFTKVRQDLAVAKIEAAVEVVEKYEQAKTPLLVFSCFKEPVYAIGRREGWAAITGDTDAKTLRPVLVDAFQGGLLSGLAMTIKTGGAGLTLTRASTVLFIDREPVPAWNRQPADRVDRIGQMADKLLIICLLANHPLEDRITEILDHREKLSGSIGL